MNPEPDQPCTEAGQSEPPDFGNGSIAPNGGQVAFVLVDEGFGRLANNAPADIRAGQVTLLHRDLRHPRKGLPVFPLQRGEIADQYLKRMSFAFSGDGWSQPAQELFQRQLRGIQGVIHGRSSNLYGIMDLTENFEWIAQLFPEGLHAPFVVVVPLAAPGVFTAGILAFVNAWDEFLLALSMNSTPAMRTLPVGITLYQGEFTFPWPIISAALIVAIVPIAVLIALFQERVVSGLTQGGLKG